MNDDANRGPGQPTHEAFWTSDLFSRGLGTVILARYKSGGRRVESGVFLVDVFCLGAKNAMYSIFERADYEARILDHYRSKFQMDAVEPCCARKLVEQAVQYAQALGIAPHPDYKKAARVFGGLEAGQCAKKFTFGDEGKPHYIRGPGETEAQARLILRQLELRCGPGKFNFTIPLGDAEDITRSFEG